MRKHRRTTTTHRDVSALDVALAACRALAPMGGRKPDLRKAAILAKFAVAMTR